MSRKCPKYGTVLYMDCLECVEKYCKKKDNNTHNKIVIGIDQSYKNTGVSIGINGQLRQVTSIRLEHLKSNSAKRKLLHDKLSTLFAKVQLRASCDPTEAFVVIERIRLQSQGFLNIDYIKSIGALNALIVDVADNYSLPVYSVDTRAWKSAIVGSSKPLENKLGINPEKYRTIKYVENLGFREQILTPVSGRKTKGVFTIKDKKYTYNDDAADSACICLYGFLPKSKQLLKSEH
jgi:Holliday junction resolvasome RuvABC endonuclease subunit